MVGSKRGKVILALIFFHVVPTPILLLLLPLWPAPRTDFLSSPTIPSYFFCPRTNLFILSNFSHSLFVHFVFSPSKYIILSSSLQLHLCLSKQKTGTFLFFPPSFPRRRSLPPSAGGVEQIGVQAHAAPRCMSFFNSSCLAFG